MTSYEVAAASQSKPKGCSDDSLDVDQGRVYDTVSAKSLVLDLNINCRTAPTIERSEDNEITVRVKDPNFIRQDILDTVMISQLQAAIGGRLLAAIGVSCLLIVQLAHLFITMNDDDNSDWLIVLIACLGGWSAILLLSTFSTKIQSYSTSSDTQQIAAICCFTSVSVFALLASPASDAATICVIILLSHNKILCKVKYTLIHTAISIGLWSLFIATNTNYSNYDEVSGPIRLLSATHVIIIASSLMSKVQPLDEKASFLKQTKTVGTDTQSELLLPSMDLNEISRKKSILSPNSSLKMRRATLNCCDEELCSRGSFCSVLTRSSVTSNSLTLTSPQTRRIRLSKVGSNTSIGDNLEDDNGFPIMRQRAKRHDSMCSASSNNSISTTNSFVSFAASVAKGASGGGYLAFKRVDENDQAGQPTDLVDAETFNEFQSVSPLCDDTTDDITSQSIIDQSVNQSLPKFEGVRKSRSATLIKRSRPSTVVHRRTIFGQVSPAQPLSPSVPSTTLVDAKKEVRDLMEIDFTVPMTVTPEGVSTFNNLAPAVLHKLVVLVSRLSEETDVLRCNYLIVAGVCEILKCVRASVFLVEGKTARTFDDEGIVINVPLDKSLVGYAALTSRVLNIPDAYCDPRFNKEVDKETGFKTKNLLVYPITRSCLRRSKNQSDNRVFAVIEAINKEEGIFTAEDECILALLGKQAGVLLSNSYFYQQLQYESNKTATLLEVSKEISDVQIDLGRMMERIMAKARQVLTVERASIFLVDEAKKELWSILTDSEMAAKVGGDNVIRLPVGVGIAGTVAQTGEMLNIADAYSSPLFNPAFDKITGYVTKAALCVPIRATATSQRVLGVMQFINKTNGQPFIEEDENLATTFSSFVGISLHNILVYEELREGQLIKEKNKELIRLRDEAKQAAEVKANFLMSMSHEIRTPMSGVIGMTELLENTLLSPEQQEMVATIRNCGESLLAIINDILDYGRLESGKMELEIACFDLVTLAEDTMDVIRSKVETKNISMNLSVDPSLVTHVAGDAFRLRQVLINLLGNAVKFTPEDGEIGMCVAPVEDNNSNPGDKILIKFSVTDTGIGIPPDKQASLFLPFHQASAGTTRQYGGSGLGLSICKQLVSCMGGEFGLVSDPDTKPGSTFWITACFQRVKEEGKHMNVGDRLRSEFTIKPKLKAVVASSNETQRAIFKTYLKLFGAECESLEDVTHLTERVQQDSLSELDIILIDATSLNGCTLEALKNITSTANSTIKGNITICIVTPMVSKAKTVQEFERYKSVYVLAKPPKQSLLAGLLQAASSTCPSEVLLQRETHVPVVEKIIKTNKKLMVAEDNKTNQILIKKQLKLFGIEPKVCDNGQMVIDELLLNRYDVILMDCHMPVLDGYGASKLIREMEENETLKGPPVNIIALTADALPHTRDDCLQAGMDDYITKPLRKSILKTTLDKWFFNFQNENEPDT